MLNVNSVNNSDNLNFGCLKSFKYRKAGLNEIREISQKMHKSSKNLPQKPSLFERFVDKFFHNSSLNYRIQCLNEQKEMLNKVV